MKPVVFLGPSLPLETAQAVLDATYLPPARQGGVVSAIQIHKPEVIGIVDGLFLQDLSVWHKEILFALERGIRVFGASSMGALRAAEMAPFGMVGIGWVYEQYASGVITNDDEVALAHGPAETGYRKLAEPLVNVRATLLAAQTEGLLDSAAYDKIVALVRRIYFPERNLNNIFRSIEEDGFSQPFVAQLRSFFAHRYVDVKRDDALLLLTTLRDCAAGTSPLRPASDATRTRMFDALYHRDRAVLHQGTEIPLASISRYAALHLREFESLRFQALNRELAVFAAQMLGVAASEREIDAETRRFRAELGLSSEAGLDAWIAGNDLTQAEFQALMRELATCRKIQRWWLSVVGRREFKAKSLLDELRLKNRYQSVAAEAAAMQASVGDGDGPDAEHQPDAAEFKQLVREHAAATAFRVLMPIETWADQTGFLSTGDLWLELLRAKRYRAMQEVK